MELLQNPRLAKARRIILRLGKQACLVSVGTLPKARELRQSCNQVIY